MAPKKKKDDKKKDGSGGSGGGAEEARPSTAPVKAEPLPEDVEDESEEAQETGTKRDGADVSKVTDYVEQQEMDHTKASRAIAAITDSFDTVDHEAEAKREKELAAVKINQEDVDTIAQEMELDKAVAERKLREHNGDAAKTLVTLVSE